MYLDDTLQVEDTYAGIQKFADDLLIVGDRQNKVQLAIYKLTEGCSHYNPRARPINIKCHILTTRIAISLRITTIRCTLNRKSRKN